MKKVLSLLVIFVFLNTTSWAYAPDYTGTGVTAANLSGTYAGVFIPSGSVSNTAGTPPAATSAATAASLGIFALGIPSTTSGTVLTQGAGVLFASGAGYNLSITGVLDPSNSQLSAILFGDSNFQIVQTITVGTTVSTITFSIQAEGSLIATITQPTGNNSVSGPGTQNAARINGTATIDTFTQVSATGPDITGTTSFTVNGFQQSATYTVPTLSIPTAGGG